MTLGIWPLCVQILALPLPVPYIFRFSLHSVSAPVLYPYLCFMCLVMHGLLYSVAGCKKSIRFSFGRNWNLFLNCMQSFDFIRYSLLKILCTFTGMTGLWDNRTPVSSGHISRVWADANTITSTDASWSTSTTHPRRRGRGRGGILRRRIRRPRWSFFVWSWTPLVRLCTSWFLMVSA